MIIISQKHFYIISCSASRFITKGQQSTVCRRASEAGTRKQCFMGLSASIPDRGLENIILYFLWVKSNFIIISYSVDA